MPTMSEPMLPIESFAYAYDAGPLETEAALKAPVKEGNCRLAIQVYYYRLHQQFIPKDQIYLPGGYKHLGRFIYEESVIDYATLQPGDIIYAQNIKNKRGEQLNRNLETYPSKDGWLYHLHSALYIGCFEQRHNIWHATSIENGTCIWSVETFEEWYRPISVKRVRGVDR